MTRLESGTESPQADSFARRTKVRSLIAHYQNEEAWSLPISPVRYLWDIPQQHYLYFSKNVYHYVGYTAEEVLTRGPSLVLSLLHPQDALNFPKIVEKVATFLRELPQGTHRQYCFSYLLRAQRVRSDEYARLLVEEVILEVDTWGNPQLATGWVSDISHLSGAGQASLHVAKVTSGKKHCLYRTTDDLLTRREREVLTLMAQGQATRQMAEELCISPNTVKNHRSNIFRKAGASNATALVRWAYENDHLMIG